MLDALQAVAVAVVTVGSATFIGAMLSRLIWESRK